MELHWQNLSEDKSLAVIAPGVWFELIISSYERKFVPNPGIYYNTYLYYYDHGIELALGTPSETVDVNIHKSNIEYAKKYASIIASSYHTQQHPYRDYPKNQ